MKQWENRREYECSLFAGLQATLHNGFPFERPQGKAFTSSMFMPGHVPAQPIEDWKVTQAMFRALAAQRKPETPEERTAERQAVRDRAARTQRAQEAAARGVTGKEIEEIICGRA